jgi:hypothetical protein
VWAVLAEELLKKEKDKLAATYELKAKELLSQLIFHLQDSPTLLTRQGSGTAQGGSSASGGGGNVGGSAYTQTALITFDRDPSAPFAVTASSAVVTNLDADMLDGQHGSYYRDASNLNAGTVPDARFPATLPAASGVNLTALNATQLTSGSVPHARLIGVPLLLKAGSGASTDTSASTLDSIALSGLTANDRLQVSVQFTAETQDSGSQLLLQNSTDTVTVSTFFGGAVTAGNSAGATVTINQKQSGATAVYALFHAVNAGTDTSGQTNSTFTTAWTGSWTLALRAPGVTAGGTLRWTWAVYKLAGQ